VLTTTAKPSLKDGESTVNGLREWLYTCQVFPHRFMLIV
jgi:hypothetical protein